MKTTKKFLAIFLALTVLFTVCSISVFASANNPWTTSDVEGREIDYNDNDGITGEGTLEILSDGRTIYYGITCLHTEPTGPICTLYAQCAVIYTDGSSECYSKSMNFVLRPREGESFLEMITISSDKEIESFSLEFQLHGNGVMYWEGYLDVPYSN